MVARSGFKGIEPRDVARALFISLKPGDPKVVAAPLDENPPDKVWDELGRLVAHYLDPATGFTARRALMKDADIAEYDHLSRFGEWDVTEMPESETLT